MCRKKDWDRYKNDIQDLYIVKGHALREVQDIMIKRYGFNACIRSYKMRLDDWRVRKNGSSKRKDFVHDPEPCASSPSYVTDDACKVNRTPKESFVIPSNQDAEKSATTFTQLLPVRDQGNYVAGSYITQTPIFSSKSIVEKDVFSTLNSGPLVNSSLMFFSTRTPSDNLFSLAQLPCMAPRALEILLRNWKPGGECMRYAHFFLRNIEYCRTIVGVNWTKWDRDRDDTLFDLVDEYVNEEEQPWLRKELLRADARFKCKLEKRSAKWATYWRRACSEPTWPGARHWALQMEVRDRLSRCALSVIAEKLVRDLRMFSERLDGIHGKRVQTEWRKIVVDCVEQGIDMKRSWILEVTEDLKNDWRITAIGRAVYGEFLVA